MNTYQKKCMALSDFYKDAARTGYKMVQDKSDPIQLASPNIHSILENWELKFVPITKYLTVRKNGTVGGVYDSVEEAEKYKDEEKTIRIAKMVEVEYDE